MDVDMSFVVNVLPILTALVEGEQTLEWDQLRDSPTLKSVLENGRVAEEEDRSLTFEEWKGMWEAAASEQTLDLGVRQQFMYDNMRATVLHLSECADVFLYLKDNARSLMIEIETRVRNDLPVGATLPSSITMVLGTTSLGYVDEQGIYIDLLMLYMFREDTKTIDDLLAHESWHFGHGSLLERHPRVNESWFMPLAQLQSEGIVNYLIGGTYQVYQHKSVHAVGEIQSQSRRFVDYADTMESQLESRLTELYMNLEKLVTGDVAAYVTYTRSLPDIPGYLHGVVMSRLIDEVYGRESLVASASDPIAFILLSAEALRVNGIDVSLPNLVIES